MKITAGQDQVTVPGLYQVLTVAVDEDGGPRYAGMCYPLLRITIEQYHELLDKQPRDTRRRPEYYTQSGETIYFWPATDVDRELEIQYHEHVRRV